tara:strand:+ start:1465 stop:1641 length:177 start_codon:yes stop_codon:yes gene_type:complete
MKFNIYIGHLEGLSVDSESVEEVKSVLIGNSKKFVQDLLEEGVIKIEPTESSRTKKKN